MSSLAWPSGNRPVRCAWGELREGQAPASLAPIRGSPSALSPSAPRLPCLGTSVGLGDEPGRTQGGSRSQVLWLLRQRAQRHSARTPSSAVYGVTDHRADGAHTTPRREQESSRNHPERPREGRRSEVGAGIQAWAPPGEVSKSSPLGWGGFSPAWEGSEPLRCQSREAGGSPDARAGTVVSRLLLSKSQRSRPWLRVLEHQTWAVKTGGVAGSSQPGCWGTVFGASSACSMPCLFSRGCWLGGKRGPGGDGCRGRTNLLVTAR